ncbi:hypothetical protein HYW19_04125 [Candidatus Woesearchaeota archaeon]|nr:hypothetical protein [Candidatus Woesearchaeota archaeon]
MATQLCPECKWESKEEDTQAYRICPACGFDAQEMRNPSDVLPFKAVVKKKNQG